MKIIRVKSGLGNQMFQYALYKQLEYLGQNVQLDISYIATHKEHNGYELENVFQISPQYADADNLTYCIEKNGGLYGKLRGRLTSKQYFSEIERFVNYDVFWIDNVILDGYWQHPDYFKSVDEQLKKDFKFCVPQDSKNFDYIEKIRKENSVAVHVRKGDYMSQGFKDYYGCICSPEYYKNAARIVSERIRDPLFFVFSDDLEWVRSNLSLGDVIYVDHNVGKQAYLDMYLMSLCKHNIIANSTFSWWAAWLNTNKNKIVITPERWCVSTRKYKNALCLKEWITASEH